MPVCFLTRKAVFCAAHRLNSPALTKTENEKTYGSCNNLNGHGHTYTVEVTIRCPVDPITGMIMDICILNDYINEAVMKPLDHKNIDMDVPYFKEHTSTMENIAIFIWKSLADLLSDPKILYKVKLSEGKNKVLFRGDFD